MQIREATEQDIPEVLAVLKASLGETSSKKTEKVWRYKHINNPFGKSLVLIAEESGIIIGVRAFMRWQWRKGNKDFSAFRAVDTATHPDHQGRGVFKKLTLKAIEIAKEQGDHFIFNTPNSQSKPGYLKMGWQEVDKIKIQLYPGNPLNWIKIKKNNYLIENPHLSTFSLENVIKNRNEKLGLTEKLFTPVTLPYLTWRYENNPLQSYSVMATDNYYVAAYIKHHKYFKELRVVEKIFDGDKGKEMIASQIRKWGNLYGAHIISSQPEKNSKLLNFSANIGPVLIIRDLDIKEYNFSNFLNIDNWAYSLGDLELF